MTQLDLSYSFPGPVFDQAVDGKPLTQQHERIKALMLDGKWRTLGEIADLLNFPESSVSAQLRHLRKPEFGSWNVTKQRRPGQRVWEYRVARI